jgi:hypothetical protein
LSKASATVSASLLSKAMTSVYFAKTGFSYKKISNVVAFSAKNQMTIIVLKTVKMSN